MSGGKQMKKRLKYHLNVIGHYLLIGWLIFIVMTILVGLLSYIVMKSNPHFVRGLMSGLSAKFPGATDNWHAFWAILLNNERVTFTMMLVGMIPIPFLYWISYVVTCASVGLVLGIYAAKLGISGAFGAFVLGILPHGIFEMSAMIVAVALAAQVNKALRQSIKRFFANPHYEKSPLDAKSIAVQYVAIVVPVIAFAAIIEGFITPVLLRLIVH
ncbi:membrane protein [Lacticaseibacillus zeae DSM 20178 = KCTC 3804]|uniref:Membrane protein n=3 Tax=Lacticaseibacillus TaxID=2759736 RepID=A0A0R1EUZ0_LACZE|nr:membrane protein [Lacticaseibacillus zeae DSM 20178 = KCTC 3804]